MKLTSSVTPGSVEKRGGRKGTDAHHGWGRQGEEKGREEKRVGKAGGWKAETEVRRGQGEVAGGKDSLYADACRELVEV